MSGTLYVVATPIGNLEDITLRALRLLRDVSVIAAEDTRRTAKLLHHHGITGTVVSFHEHNKRGRMPELLRRLKRGESVALVSDAGTPALADPGLELIQACIQADISVDPVPGASAPLAALVASGFPTQPATILGFVPSKANARIVWLRSLAIIPHTCVFFETPHRIRALLDDAADVLGNRPLCVARELTKVHQELLRGTPRQLAERLKETRGEFTLVLGPALEEPHSTEDAPSSEVVASEFRHLTESGKVSRRQAVSALSRKYGRPSREIYSMLEDVKRGVS